MNGLKAIELMKQGKMIKSGIWIYSMDSDGVIWLKTESHTGWVGAQMFNILANDYEEYIEPKTLTGWERVGQSKDKFYYVSATEEVMKTNDDCHLTAQMYDNANYFSTKEKAEEINFKQTLFRKLQRFSDENGGNEIDWNDDLKGKWFIVYNHDLPKNKRLYADNYVSRQFVGTVYFISREIAEQAIEVFHDELIKYFTGDFGGEV